MSPADDRWSRGARGHWFQAVLCVAATLGLIGLFFVPAVAPAMLKLEHWTADWRTAWLSDRRATAHPDLAIVTIDLAALEPYPFLLPISRSLQADIVDILARSGVRAIALDFYYIKATVPEDDEPARERKESYRSALLNPGRIEKVSPPLSEDTWPKALQFATEWKRCDEGDLMIFAYGRSRSPIPDSSSWTFWRSSVQGAAIWKTSMSPTTGQ